MAPNAMSHFWKATYTTNHLTPRRGRNRKLQRSTWVWFCQSSCIIIRQDLLQEQKQKKFQDSVVNRSTGSHALTGSSVRTEASVRTGAHVRTEVAHITLENQHAFLSCAEQEILLEQELRNPAGAPAPDPAGASEPADAAKSRSGRSLLSSQY